MVCVPFVVYALRHTFLSRLGAAGSDAWTLSRIAGILRSPSLPDMFAQAKNSLMMFSLVLSDAIERRNLVNGGETRQFDLSDHMSYGEGLACLVSRPAFLLY